MKLNSGLKTAFFERFTLEMPRDAVEDCSHSGSCDEDVAHWALELERPEECDPESLAAELLEYGCWDYDELADDATNWQRIVWLAACQIRDEELNAS